MDPLDRAQTYYESFCPDGQVVVYVEILDELLPVCGMMFAQPRPDGTYLLLSAWGKDEEWKFPLGTVVRCRQELRGERTILYACEAVT